MSVIDGSEECPHYRKFKQEASKSFYGIAVDEGWRSSILCADLYEWAADWLVNQLQGKPLPSVRKRK